MDQLAFMLLTLTCTYILTWISTTALRRGNPPSHSLGLKSEKLRHVFKELPQI